MLRIAELLVFIEGNPQTPLDINDQKKLHLQASAIYFVH